MEETKNEKKQHILKAEYAEDLRHQQSKGQLVISNYCKNISCCVIISNYFYSSDMWSNMPEVTNKSVPERRAEAKYSILHPSFKSVDSITVFKKQVCTNASPDKHFSLGNFL